MNNTSSVTALQSASKPQLVSSRFSQTCLGGDSWHEVSEPEELEPDVLLKGGVHQIFTGPGEGKTWLALWFIARNIEREQTAIFLDMENGKRIVKERLKLLGVGGNSVDDHLHYRDFPSLDMTIESKSDYERLLDWKNPNLVIFDSWIGFLAACGLDENSPTHVEEWGNAYINPAKLRGCTVVILDHVPHDANRSRGATRKKDLVDVQWHLKKKDHFDRETVGYVQLTKEKDREAWLPNQVGFTVGVAEDGFVFSRSAGTIDQSEGDLTGSAKAALGKLESFGEGGATYTEWRDSIPWKGKTGMPDKTFRTAKKKIENQVQQDTNGRYSRSTVTTVTPVGQSTVPYSQGSLHDPDDGSDDGRSGGGICEQDCDS